MKHFEYAPSTPSVGEHLPYPAPIREVPDWRRLETAMGHHGDQIADGIGHVAEHHTDVDDVTARCIAHVLGRSYGESSALAEYALRDEGDYEALREEYLALYHDANAPAWAVELIDYLGTHLIRRSFPDASTPNHFSAYPQSLAHLHVPTQLTIGDYAATVHVPGIYGAEAISGLANTLAELQLDKDPGLQAFLSIPGVNAMSGDIMEDFHTRHVGTWQRAEDAFSELCLLDDREEEIQDFASERHLFYDYLTPDYGALREELEEDFTLIEHEGVTYVFSK